MKKASYLGICLLFLGICTADSADIIPTIIMLGSGAALLIGTKLCGIIVP